MVNWIYNEIETTSVLKNNRPILIKILLFQSSGHGYPSDSAKNNFCNDSKSSISEISNDVSFLSDFFEIGENRQKCLTKKPGMRQLNYPNVFRGII